MTEFNITNVLELLERASDSGISIDLVENSLELQYRREKGVDSRLLEELRLNKPFLLEYFQKYAGKPASAEITVQRTWSAEKAGIPLSFAQERVCFIHRLQGSIQYHVPWIFRLKGPLNIKALEFAFREIVRRHEVLRTVIRENDGVGYQEVIPADGWEPDNFTEEEIIAGGDVVSDFLERRITAPYDLSKDWMLKVAIIRISEKEHLVLTMVHHIAFDGWSVQLMVKELTELYGGYAKGKTAVLQELPLQYRDFAFWQRTEPEDRRRREQLDYWRTRLEGVPLLRLPADYPRPAQQSVHGGEKLVMVNRELAEKLVALSREEGATLFMTMLAVFKVLLYQYTDQRDICIGTPVLGRRRLELESLIGFFVNTLAIRSGLSREMSFRGFLRKVKAIVVEAYDHQDAPFEKIVEELKIERDLTRSPVFQVMFELQNVPNKEELDLGDLKLEAEERTSVSCKFDLDLSITEFQEGMRLRMFYCTDLFTERTIERMLGHYRLLLELVVKDRYMPIGKLPLISGTEATELLNTFNDSEEWESEGETLIRLFGMQVRRTPEKVAVVYGKSEVSYRQLDERSDRVALRLRELGVVRGDLVLLMTSRSVEMIVGMLGILKAGGAYVPVDVDGPEERLDYMVSDTGAKVLVRNGVYGERLLLGESALEVVELEEGEGGGYVGGSGWEVEESDLAYVIYTSGSTGKPKGVMVEHGSIVNFIRHQSKYLGIDGEERVALFSSYSFDASVEQVFLALTNGALLVVMSEEERRDKVLCEVFLRSHRITHLHVTPSFLQTITPGKYGWLKRVLVGGEACRRELAEQWKGEVDFYNTYGPTEAAVTVAEYRCGGESDGGSGVTVPIGKAVANTRLYVLNGSGEPVAIGVTGELWIGGIQVARGYLNNEGLTEERFKGSEFRERERLYRTGDMVRWMPDGNIEYLGRVDDQVKVRGYRVELGEIESVLQGAPGVGQSVVLATEGADGNKRLTGYVVMEGVFDQGALLDHLRGKLPEYMIPGLLVSVSEIPLTTNGKVDKKALGRIDLTTALSSRYAAPRNAMEEQMVDIWKQLLRVDQIGIHDNFFELGGHSLLVTRLVSAIRKKLDIELSIKDIFLYPDIASLVRRFDTDANKSFNRPIVAQRRKDPIPLSFAQERLWFIDRFQGSVPYHMPWVFRTKGKLDLAALENSFRKIIERHEILRTVIREKDGEGYQHILPASGWKPAYWQAGDIEADGGDFSVLIEKLIAEPYDLALDWMMKLNIIEVREDEFVILVLLHHIAFDGWAVSVMVKELTLLYKSFVEMTPVLLPDLPIQYADYAIWQRGQFEGNRLEGDLEYWYGKLKDVTMLQLPADFPRPAEQSLKGGEVWRIASPELQERLVETSRKHNATLFMLLLSVFKVLLYRYTNEEDICVGVSLANRTRSEMENLIGFFVNAVAIRTELRGDMTFRDLLDSVKNTTLEAYDHQEMPFEKVVEMMRGKRQTDANPMFSIMFVLQNTPETGDLELPGVEISSEPYEKMTSKFDLTFSLKERRNGLAIHAEYSKDLFREERIERMLDHFESLLKSVTETTDMPIGRLQILTETEKHLLIHGFNDTVVSIPENVTAVDLFEKTAAGIPDVISVICATGDLTYRHLNEQANKLAHYLRMKGIGRESIVPLLAERSPETIVGILGILKSGAAYVPIDPTYPGERIAALLDDIAPAIIVNASGARIDLISGIEMIDVGLERSLFSDMPASNPSKTNAMTDLAYVIYTSGSTGMPKGVLIEHRSLLNYLLSARKRYMDDAGSGSFVHLSWSFDASITALFLPLICGQAVVMAPAACSPAEVFDSAIFQQNDYSFIKLTPLHIQLLQDTLISHGTIFTKRLVVGGEALNASHLRCLYEKGCEIEVVNEYGPTEATVGCTTYTFTSRAEDASKPILIGKPLQNVRIYILSPQMELAPIGIAGELFIGGMQVARGYLKRPELTAERFVDSPFLQGDRLYRTGDLARWLEDGNIEFIGRLDHQMKVNGYRIEPGEVEAAVNALPVVSECCVVAQQDVSMAHRLKCYFVPSAPAIKEKERLLFLQKVAQWKELYESEYGGHDLTNEENEEFNLAGWTDSFTGGFIPPEQMREWLEDTMRVIFEQEPEHVLEIGCGSGLICYQLIDRIKSYTGTDLSRAAVDRISQHISKGKRKYPQTDLFASAAHEISVENRKIDTVILNSVIQYFPGEGYLRDVLRNAIFQLNGRGRIIIGDVRDLRLLHLFKGVILLNRVPESAHIRDFRHGIGQMVMHEEELCLSPEYFYNLKSIFPEITHVEIQWKQTEAPNELTLYRYMVTLYIGIEKPHLNLVWEDWRSMPGKSDLVDRLRNEEPSIALSNVPNSRLWREQRLAEALIDKSVQMVQDIRRYIGEQDMETSGLAAILDMAKQYGYHCKILVADQPLDVNLVLTRDAPDGFIRKVPKENAFSESGPVTNVPLFRSVCTIIGQQVHRQLQQQLPEYMIPSEFTGLDELPVTRNGKTDRGFLSHLVTEKHADSLNREPPVTQTEKELVAIWEEVLGTRGIGVGENFFELGGHSILMVQVLHRLAGRSLTLMDMFAYPTIRDLAGIIDSRSTVIRPAGSGATDKDIHLLKLREGRPDSPLFIVPGALGICDSYDRLSEAIEIDHRIYGLQMMGFTGNERPLKTMEDCARQNIRWMRSIQPRGPYKLIGHSFGGYVCYEMVRQLEMAGEEFDFVSIIDVEAHSTKREPPTEGGKIGLLLRIAQLVFERYGLISQPYPRWVGQLENELVGLETIDNMKARLIDLALQRFSNRSEEIKLFLKLFELQTVNALMSRKIQPASLRASLNLLRGADQDWSNFREDLEWGRYFSSVEVLDVPGDHENLLDVSYRRVGMYYAERINRLFF